MTIVCPKCGTKFRFDEKEMEADGVWCRCCRCQKVFFHKRPHPTTFYVEEVLAPGITEEPQLSTGIHPEATPDKVQEDAVAEGSEPTDYRWSEEAVLHSRSKGRGLWTKGKIAAYIIVLVVILAGVYVTIFPEVGLHLLGKTPLAGYFGIQVADNPAASGIDLLGVRERFVENKMVGTVMVIQGNAVNRNDHPVSKLKVRARLVDSAGDFTAEAEAYCGVLLNEEELTNLTEQELRSELGKDQGRDVPNVNIASGATIPFMIVVGNAPQRTTEYIVELAGLQKALK